jgi:hypothetical protein
MAGTMRKKKRGETSNTYQIFYITRKPCVTIVHVADTAQENLKGIQVRPVDSYELVRGHVPEPEPLPAPAPGLELVPASLQRPDCCTWAAADHVDRLMTG